MNQDLHESTLTPYKGMPCDEESTLSASLQPIRIQTAFRYSVSGQFVAIGWSADAPVL